MNNREMFLWALLILCVTGICLASIKCTYRVEYVLPSEMISKGYCWGPMNEPNSIQVGWVPCRKPAEASR